jgi:hypothetical protein
MSWWKGGLSTCSHSRNIWRVRRDGRNGVPPADAPATKKSPPSRKPGSSTWPTTLSPSFSKQNCITSTSFWRCSERSRPITMPLAVVICWSRVYCSRHVHPNVAPAWLARLVYAVTPAALSGAEAVGLITRVEEGVSADARPTSDRTSDHSRLNDGLSSLSIAIGLTCKLVSGSKW